jgi:hypothetical protein
MALHQPRPRADVSRPHRRGARSLYLKYRDQKNVTDGKSWQAVILDDFAQLRKAGLNNPLMDEIEKTFASAG